MERIISQPSNDAYRENWDAIFGGAVSQTLKDELREALFEAEHDLEWIADHTDRCDNPEELMAQQRLHIAELRRRLGEE